MARATTHDMPSASPTTFTYDACDDEWNNIIRRLLRLFTHDVTPPSPDDDDYYILRR